MAADRYPLSPRWRPIISGPAPGACRLLADLCRRGAAAPPTPAMYMVPARESIGRTEAQRAVEFAGGGVDATFVPPALCSPARGNWRKLRRFCPFLRQPLMNLTQEKARPPAGLSPDACLPGECRQRSAGRYPGGFRSMRWAPWSAAPLMHMSAQASAMRSRQIISHRRRAAARRCAGLRQPTSRRPRCQRTAP